MSRLYQRRGCNHRKPKVFAEPRKKRQVDEMEHVRAQLRPFKEKNASQIFLGDKDAIFGSFRTRFGRTPRSKFESYFKKALLEANIVLVALAV